MRPKTYLPAIFFLFLIVLSISCEETIEFKSAETEPKIVVNAVFSGGSKYKYVRIEKSRSILNDRRYFEALPEATVKLYEDGEFLTELQYVSARDTFYEHLNYGVTKKYPYEHGSYVDSVFVVNPGSTYRLEISHEGFEPVSCETTVPYPVELGEMNTTIEHTPKQYNENLYQVKIKLELKDPVSENNFYRLGLNNTRGVEAALGGSGYGGYYGGGPYGGGYYGSYNLDSIVPTDTIIKQFDTGGFLYSFDPVLSQSKGADILETELDVVEFFDDRLINSGNHELSFWFQTYRDVYVDFGEYLQVNAYITHLSKELYDYSLSAQQQIWVQDNPFAEPVPVFSNIKGGIGIFGSLSISQKYSVIGEYPMEGKVYMERNEYYDYPD